MTSQIEAPQPLGRPTSRSRREKGVAIRVLDKSCRSARYSVLLPTDGRASTSQREEVSVGLSSFALSYRVEAPSIPSGPTIIHPTAEGRIRWNRVRWLATSRDRDNPARCNSPRPFVWHYLPTLWNTRHSSDKTEVWPGGLRTVAHFGAACRLHACVVDNSSSSAVLLAHHSIRAQCQACRPSTDGAAVSVDSRPLLAQPDGP